MGPGSESLSVAQAFLRAEYDRLVVLRDAAYAILHVTGNTTEDRIEFRRVRYDIERTQRLMRDAGLPPRLVERLGYGF